MIAYIADRRAPVSRAALAGLLWSDHPEQQARAHLRLALTRTRQYVPQVHGDRSTVALNGNVRLDLHDIEDGDLHEALGL
ncbi:MAG: DNA-binding SARP family transcriptional activator [Candidatus Poriferisodalaceae bacterium]